MHDRLRYRRGSTTVNSTAAEVWELGTGVCQDYTHVALGALRSIGLPARYVSGYLHPGADAAGGATVTGESHSWVEWWCGTWVSYDPTQGQRLTDRYVRVGQGRDYGDVAPLRGTYSGGVVGDVRDRVDDRARLTLQAESGAPQFRRPAVSAPDMLSA